MKIIALTQCLECTKGIVYFHFKGVFLGKKISLIKVITEHSFKINEEYLLFIELVKVHNKTLEANLIESRNLNSIYY